MSETTVDVGAPKDTATRTTTRLMIDGMTCGNCARHVTQAIQGVPGVRNATVSLDAHQATVRWQPDAARDEAAVIQAVKKEGFGAQLLEDSTKDHAASRSSGWGLNLWIGIPVTALLMIGEWVLGLGTMRWFQWCSFGLAALVQGFAGARFYRGAWSQLKAGNSNMDTLVALGSSTAFAYSTWSLLSGGAGHVYFMEAAAIITLISAGHWMEARVSLRATSTLRKLLNLAPALALRRNQDGTQTEVPVDQIHEGEQIALRPGDRVPTDGIVLEGASAVDESMLTGEPLPVDKKPGREIYAGTVNLDGSLVARVTATGEGTALAHIVAAVQRAQTSRATIQRLGDRVSSVFVPIVVGIALLSALWWAFAPASAIQVHQFLGRFLWHAQPVAAGGAAGLIIAASVLIIACPCAMGLATPAAIMAGSNAAAQRGILIRDGIALEKAGEVTAVVFDKTGTLTTGKPKIVEVCALPGTLRLAKEDGQAAVKRLSASLARPSGHPISKVVADLTTDPLPISEWREIRGSGVQGKTPDAQGVAVTARMGSLRWFSESGVDLAPAHAFVSRWTNQGATIIGVAVDQDLVGLIAVQDTLKPGAAEVVGQLAKSGLKVFLLTGDNSLTAGAIGRQAGIPAVNVFADVRPEQKAQLIQKLQQQGERVAFVGDGINDAPALEQADLGIAVSRASDVAREAADIILLKSEIGAIPESLGLARATLRTIHQNLFWAFFYNAMGIPLAALGFMSPILCAAAMGLSDLVVIGNALRLSRWRLKPTVSSSD